MMGHRLGEVRKCPGCGEDHAVGTTCRPKEQRR